MALKANFVQEGSCYTSDLERLGVARGALRFSLEWLNRSQAVREIEQLLKIATQRNITRELGHHKKADTFNRQIYEKVDAYIDDYVLVAAYENYLKAKLLIYGYVIHKIDPIDNNLKLIAKQQRKNPIEIKAIPPKVTRINGKKQEEVFASLKKQTVNISVISGQKKYCEALNLSPDISKKLLGTIKERNKIHYWVVNFTNLSSSKFEDIYSLTNYLRSDVKKLLSKTEEQFDKLR
jgi:hypothetical protein